MKTMQAGEGDSEQEESTSSSDGYSIDALYFEFEKSQVKNLSLDFGAAEVAVIEGNKYCIETRGLPEEALNCYLNKEGTLVVSNAHRFNLNFWSHNRRSRIVPRILVTIPAGWALSRKNLMFRKAFMVYFIIPMFFGGGLIPFYNVMSSLHLVNTVWAIILPSVLSVWNLFMTKTFFESSIPNSLIEAAKIDGAGHFRTFITVVVPLAKPIIAVMALYYAIGQWNSYFNAMIFLQNEKLYPLQLVLKEILIATESTVGGSGETILEQYRLATQIKYVSVIVSSIPVLMLYPFVQKYFEQGVMIGSLKE